MVVWRARRGGSRKDGGRAGWGAYPRAKPAPRRHGCRRSRPAAWWQALDAKRRRLPHREREKCRRARPARKEACDAAAVALADKMPLRQTGGGDRTGQDAGGCHQAKRLATARKACHTCAPECLPATPCGRPVPEPAWRARARAARDSPCPGRGRRPTRSGGGCHTGDVKCGGVRIRHARSLRRGGRCAGRQRCRCGKGAAETVAVRMRAAATKRKRLAPPGKACHACAGSYLRSTPCGRPVPGRYGVRMHAPRV
jgi:hypothetical protein